MPRQSAEARSASLWRTGGKPPSPPRHLTQPARKLWRTITEALPADYFPGFTLPMLENYIRCLIECDRVVAALEKANPGSPEAKVMTGNLKTLRSIAAADARQLRLSLSSRIGRKSGILDETGPGRLPEHLRGLIGGRANRAQ